MRGQNGQFLPGSSGNESGRPRGAKSRTSAAVKEALLRAFDEVGGEAWLVKLAKSDPRTFAVLLGKVLPREVGVAVSEREGLAEKILAARKRARDHGHDVAPESEVVA